MILLHHPDKRVASAGDASNAIAGAPETLNVAYEVLYDSARRAAYDAELQARQGGSTFLDVMDRI